MATAVLVRTEVFSSKLFRGRGDVRVWLNRVTARFGAEAKHYAPVRSGRMRAQISTTTRTVGAHQCSGTIASRAPYTMYVLRGTTGPIMSDTAWGSALDLLRRPDGSYPAGTFMPIPAWGPFRARPALIVDPLRGSMTADRGSVPGPAVAASLSESPVSFPLVRSFERPGRAASR